MFLDWLVDGANEGLGREQGVHTKYLSVGLMYFWGSYICRAREGTIDCKRVCYRCLGPVKLLTFLGGVIYTGV